MSKKTLNHANLAGLGPDRLAELLLEVSAGSADIKRRLRLELAHNLGPQELARDVRKRLATLRKSKTFVGWRKRKVLARDLATQAAMITNKIGPEDPTTAFELLWEFMDLAPPIFARTQDKQGEVMAVFLTALTHFNTLAQSALVEEKALAEKVWRAVQDNPYGVWDDIITTMVPALGTGGVDHLKALIATYAGADDLQEEPPHEAIAFLRELRGGAKQAQTTKARFVQSCLQEIAAATGDTQGYIAQFTARDLQDQGTSAKVAMLLLEEGQPQRAYDLLRDADRDGYDGAQRAWDAALIACLTTLDRVAEAQDHRWACFEDTLNDVLLREHLKLLDDFDDVEAEERAKAYAADFPDFSKALQFFLDWPDLHAAAQLVIARPGDIDGDRFELISRAAEALRTRHPLATVILMRAVINTSLGYGRVARYAAAADYLSDCVALDQEIATYGDHPTHGEYVKALQTRHERKASFWDKVV